MEDPLLAEIELGETPRKENIRQLFLGENTDQNYVSNLVTTSKYNGWTFVPKFLMLSFRKPANLYFLFICILQVIPGISNSFGVPTMAFPLSIVIIVDAIFEIIEDCSRHRADKAANQRETLRYAKRKFDSVMWQDIHVGDILLIKNMEMVPADMLLLTTGFQCEDSQQKVSSRSEGYCYVETCSLDGETNLKMKEALQFTVDFIKTQQSLSYLQGKIEYDLPNGAIHQFSGVYYSDFNNSIPSEEISCSNVLLRGSVVRNSPCIYGIVLNTGHDTKIMQAGRNECPSKISFLDYRVDTEFAVIIGFLLSFCAIAATIGSLYNVFVLVNTWYLPLRRSILEVYTETFFRFILMLSNMVPISLYVTLDVVRSLQSYFMQKDLKLYDGATNTPCKVKTMELNGDLGQVSHILTDKTGTLTCNIMSFRKCSVYGTSYGEDNKDYTSETEKWVTFRDRSFVSFMKPLFDEKTMIEKVELSNSYQIHEFLLHLAICHSVMVESPESEIVLSASSPDEQALVSMAKAHSYEFVDRKCNEISLKLPLGVCGSEINEGIKRLDNAWIVTFKILHLFEFTSLRKRMSVLFWNPLSNSIELYIKGADDVIFNRLNKNLCHPGVIAKTQSSVELYSNEGLRTLVMAKKIIDTKDFEQWQNKFVKAKNDIYQLQLQSKRLPNRIDSLINELECDLKLIGASAIEDRLQAGVPSTIQSLQDAGIRVSMITGDHPQTAINIAISCRLLDSFTKQIMITKDESSSLQTTKRLILKHRDSVQEELTTAYGLQDYVLVVDGETLTLVLRSNCHKEFLFLLDNSLAFIASRVSPTQKAKLAQLVKNSRNKPGRVLAIGDGANDVAMIQTADIGVGISGKEGLQAANSSDYVIGQFQFLNRLLVGHGRFNYQRISLVISYIFYKNILLVMSQFCYSIFNGMSGQKIYNDLSVNLFNTFFTSAPIVIVGVLDMDVPMWVAERLSFLYKTGPQNKYFTRWVFWSWIVWGFIDSGLICLIGVVVFSGCDSAGRSFGMWEFGAVIFTLVILVVNLKLANQLNQWSTFEIIFWVLSIGLWFGIAFFLSADPSISFDWFGLFPTLLSAGICWLTLIFASISLSLKDIAVKAYQQFFHPSVVQKVQIELQEQNLLGTFANVGGFHSNPNDHDPASSDSERRKKRGSSSTFAITFDPYTAQTEANICTFSV